MPIVGIDSAVMGLLVSEFAVVLAAAGRSSRFADPGQKKVFASLAGKPVWMHAAEFFSKRSDVGQIILVIAAEDRELFNEKFAGHAAMLGVQTVLGGSHRAASVSNALQHLDGRCPFVAIHDAARPCLASQTVDAVFNACRQTKAAILALPCHATIKRVDAKPEILDTVPRDGLWLAQTPQCFDAKLLQQCYSKHPDPAQATDDAAIVQHFSTPVRVVEGSPLNIKITTQADLKFAELALKALPQSKSFPFS